MRLKKINTVIFDEFTHSYICGDKLLIGVTTLMKKHGLSPDYGDIPADILAKAAARGTAVHNLLEDYDNGKAVQEDEAGNLKAYKELGLKIHCSEYLVTDNDIVASFIDKVYDDCSLADVKTTSTVHTKSVAWQLSIYAYLFEKMNPSKKVPHIYCIHVRDGKAKEIELNRIPNEKIEALLQAEKEGRIYEDDEQLPDASLVLQDQDVLSLVATLDIIAQYKAALKAEEERAAALQDKLYQYMVDNNLDEMGCTSGKFIRKAEYTRTSIDSTKLKKEMPEIFEKYQKTSVVKGSVTFKAI